MEMDAPLHRVSTLGGATNVRGRRNQESETPRLFPEPFDGSQLFCHVNVESTDPNDEEENTAIISYPLPCSNRGTCDIDQCVYNGTIPCADPLGADPDNCLESILETYNSSNPLDIFMADVQCCQCQESWEGNICEERVSPPPPSPSTGDDLPLGAILTISLVGFLVGATVVGVFLYFKYRKQARDALVKINRRLRMPPPQTQATIVFTDVESSTKLWEWNAQAMKESLQISFKVMRSLLKKYYGYESNTEGDAICVVFHTETDAVAWALDVQQALLYPAATIGADWPEDILGHSSTKPVVHNGVVIYRGLRIRIGIHSGRKEDVATTSEEENAPAKRRFFGDTIHFNCLRRSQDSVQNHSSGTTPVEEEKGREDNDVEKQEGKESESEQTSNITRRASVGNASTMSADTENGEFSAAMHHQSGRIRYVGPAVELAKKISDVPSGGQILMSGSTLGNIALQQLEQNVRIIHMGEHHLAANKPPVELIQILPTSLLGRLYYFSPLRRTTQISPSYFEAPGVLSKGLDEANYTYNEVVIVFMFLTGIDSLNQWDRVRTESATTAAVHCIRGVLRQYKGYEVEETEGNMMLAFGKFQDAVLFSVIIQEELNKIEWDSNLLAQPAASEIWESLAASKGQKHCLFRGLRYKVGLEKGVPTSIEPHASTGRAAYFGPVTSRAARVAAMASGGQVLCLSKQWKECVTDSKEIKRKVFSVELGAYRLKGIESSQSLVQLSTPSLAQRPFGPLGGTLDKLFAKFVPFNLSQRLMFSKNLSYSKVESVLSSTSKGNLSTTSLKHSQPQSLNPLGSANQDIEMQSGTFGTLANEGAIAYEAILSRNEYLEAEVERLKSLYQKAATKSHQPGQV
mmetsp:Transcript_10819/g.66850  ORF Transcript_10819/g.66850 Transcript_10819/m.66850 type:complete len:862 (-) Transcript_10819:1790-4375(-)